MDKEREEIKLTEEELEDFDVTAGCISGQQWIVRDETYNHVETIRTDEFSDGESWDTIVKRHSDGKFFKWHCWESSHGYVMEDGKNKMVEVFPKTITKTIYE